MVLDITRMRAKVRKPLGLDITDADMSDDDIDEYLNLSFWEIQGKFPFREKEKTVTFQTTDGVRNYDMPKPFDALQSLSIVDATTGQHTKLERATIDYYEGTYNEEDDSKGTPTAYVREGCFARLLPTPDGAYTIVLKRLVTLTDLSASNTTLGVPQEWTEIVIFGAVWRAFIDLGDFARANQMKNHQISLINSTVPTKEKEDRDSQHAGLEVLRRDY